MNKKEANNFVKNTIGSILKERGYKYVGWDESFHLKKDDITYKIGWACVDRWQAYEIGYYLCIRSEKVSDIFNQFARIQPKYHREATTFVRPFAYFTGEQMNKSVQITVSDQTCEQDVIDSFLHIYEEKVKPFMDEHSSLEKISSFILNSIDNNRMWGDPSSIYMKSIILLKLTDSTLFSEKADAYKKALSGFADWQQDDFNKLVEYLKSS
jgi:hypothetical protein